MIKLENTKVVGFKEAIRGMRNPMNSWDQSDSFIYNNQYYIVGPKDYMLMKRLAHSGTTHSKYRRMIVVYVDITAPLYWWKEFDTYKVGTVANSCSTMHKIHSRILTMDDFSVEHLFDTELAYFKEMVDLINSCIKSYNDARENIYNYSPEKQKAYWWQIIQLLPSSYNQRRTVMLNYEVLANIYNTRLNHKLDEWREFCRWIKDELNESWIITCDAEDQE